MMHGNSNTKFIVAKQAKEIFQYRNTKRTPDGGSRKHPKHVE
jgi:hypothetical protein